MSKHLKRLAAPRSWPVPRRTSVWITKPACGPHPIVRSAPLILVIRDFLHYCNNAGEAKRIISSGDVYIDGKKVKDYKRPVGLMDVVSIPKTKEYFRVLLDSKGKLRLVKIPEENSKWKLVRIENKTPVKKGKIQLNLHDSKNIILEKNAYHTGDSLKIELPSHNILDCYPIEKGNTALIIGGKHSGQIAKITATEIIKSPQPNLVMFENFSTIKNHVFVIGKETPVVTLPEVSAI